MKLKTLFIYLLLVFSCIFALSSCDLSNSSDDGNIPGDDVLMVGIDSFISALAIDADDNIWLGSVVNGLKKFDGEKLEPLLNEDGNNFVVQALDIDSEGIIWIGTKSGAYKYSGTTLEKYTTENGLVSNDIRSIWIDYTNDIVWFGTSHNGISSYDGLKFTRDTLNFEASMGYGHVHTINGDQEGNLYFGSCISGLSKFDGMDWEHKLNNLSTFVLCSCLEKDGSAWFGTPYGLYHFSSGNWLKYTIDNGLPSDNIYTINVSDDGTVWVGTEFGVTSFDKVSWKSHSPLDGGEFKSIMDFVFDSKGNVWAGGYTGLFKVDISGT